MILQALKEYYDRKASDPSSGIAPFGFEWKEIPYIVVLDKEGEPVALQATYEGTGKDKRAKVFLVPQAEKKTSGIKSNLLWDNPEYTLGLARKGKPSKPDRIAQQHVAFCERVDELGPIKDKGFQALKAFLGRKDKIKLLKRFDLFSELEETAGYVSFSFAGEKGLILESPSIRKSTEKLLLTSQDQETAVCLVTGEIEPIRRLDPVIKGVRGAQSTGSSIISFNLDPFKSYGKDQGFNAPIGFSGAFAYTTALNHLLGKDSPQRMQVGDATTVFWSEKPDDLEAGIVDIFGEPPKDDPDKGVRAVRDLYKAVNTGVLVTSAQANRFYVLGLAPNSSRLSVRFWHVDTVAGMAARIVRHFDDLCIARSPRDIEYLPLFRLLVATAAQDKADNIPPNLAGDTMRAILEGLPYPQTLLQACVRRIRADHRISYARAALIKACINRRTRFDNPDIKEELTVSLDTANTNIGYRLGRLFATLEKIQAEANPGINATIRDRFYGAASGTPVAVFSNLMRLKNHHLAKMESRGRQIYFEKLIAEIMDAVSDFPAHLALADQGRFAIGYYHQTQKFFTKKEATNGNAAENLTEGDADHE